MIRRFFRHLGESNKNLKRNSLPTLTVFSVMIVLSLLGVFYSVILNTQKLSDIEKKIRSMSTWIQIHQMPENSQGNFLDRLLLIKTTIRFMMLDQNQRCR